jgi:SAM-dependent methyltransferase
MKKIIRCRHCESKIKLNFLDLGFSPPSNAYIRNLDNVEYEKHYPLKVNVCEKCWLVQTEDFANAEELFNNDYAYFSSTSSSWLEHAKSYASTIIDELKLTTQSLVIELASNDGYMLKNFTEKGIPSIGIEPTESTANKSMNLGAEIITEFFTKKLAEKLKARGSEADLIIGNNVYAHVPDINDFTASMKTILKVDGVITLEFPHLLELIKNNQFDTVYHEHFSYLSLGVVNRIFKKNRLKIYKVESLKTHGGSLRIYGAHEESGVEIQSSVLKILEIEKKYGLFKSSTYKNFQLEANKIKNQFLSFLIEKKMSGKKVMAYGAAAKGNTLLNYAGVKTDLIEVVFDAAKYKQNQYLPGSHIPIYAPERMQKFTPDFLIIFPWNIANEVMEKNKLLHEKGTRFVTFIPKLKIL